jgi:hypothetical protein
MKDEWVGGAQFAIVKKSWMGFVGTLRKFKEMRRRVE